MTDAAPSDVVAPDDIIVGFKPVPEYVNQPQNADEAANWAACGMMWLPLNQGESDAAEAKGEYVLRRKEPDSDEEWAFACELCKAEEAIKFTRKDLESGNPGIWERITRALKWDVSIKLVFMCQDCVDTFKT